MIPQFLRGDQLRRFPDYHRKDEKFKKKSPAIICHHYDNTSSLVQHFMCYTRILTDFKQNLMFILRINYFLFINNVLKAKMCMHVLTSKSKMCASRSVGVVCGYVSIQILSLMNQRTFSSNNSCYSPRNIYSHLLVTKDLLNRKHSLNTFVLTYMYALKQTKKPRCFLNYENSITNENI